MPVSDDPDELMMERAIAEKDPLRMPKTLDRIEWRLMYGEFGIPTAVWFLGGIIIVLLSLILWRIW